ncbi:hypothetical protein NEPTK9_001819, partial [Candidatus Neptunochlamydia vexilliferae]|nr:hypothetical protein [Candidatus Neptunochlamydia vexilliferae]MBF5060206.1 hypothetical protein [Candidatus Neptunochlamydia vexilliferae]MBF5060216.1 hypothetical protein [Candidatus Neptunochlamydia vexilliferae]MBF5060255.1 hypothetical protein [Candidatus Neptunochlamydia vexilliferae]MBF5060285.1 hypothetical protein [Candidatus Neptunochlamydia vexilliferae]
GQAPRCPLELQSGKPNRPFSGGRAKHCSTPRAGRFCRAILKPRTAHRMVFLRLRLRSHVSSLERFFFRKPRSSFTKQ